MKHDDLIDELINSLDHDRWMHFKNLNTGSAWMDDKLGRIDAFSLKKSYTKTDKKIYEIKVSQSDFNGDVKSGKYLKYLPYCNLFYFAILDNIKWKDIVGKDPNIGIIRYNKEKGWRVVKAPKYRAIDELSEAFYKSILFNKIDRKEGELYRLMAKFNEQKACYKKGVVELRLIADRTISKRAQEVHHREVAIEQKEKDLRKKLMKEILNSLEDSKISRWGEIDFWESYLIEDIQKLVKYKIVKLKDEFNKQKTKR